MTSAPTLSRPVPTEPEQVPTDPPRFQLSAVQVIASALAAITATVAASYLGIAGTVIGAAVASVLTVTGNAVYSHSLRRTGNRVVTVVPAAARLVPRAIANTEPAAAQTRATAPTRHPQPHRGRWTTAVAACLGVFAGVLLVVTGVELVAGRPLSDVVRGQQGSGTSVLGTTANETRVTTPTPRVTVTVTPTVVTTTPTVTVTGAPVTKTAPAATTTTTPTATATPTSSPTASPTASPSSSPGGSASSTG